LAYYESVFIARQDLSSTQAEGLADTFQKVIEDQGGKVTKRESWGLRSLAYKIKKNRKGHYALFNIDAPSAAIEEMERQMRLHEDVLRSLTIRIDELDDEPSAVMQGRGEREPRGGGRGGRRGERDDKPRGDRKRDEAPASEAKTQGDKE
jgi:small subunit ribosomal protein S6